MRDDVPYLEYLQEQRCRPVSVRHQFLSVYQKKPKGLFIFFEGNDDRAFYMPEIRRQLVASNANNDVHPFLCDGKKGVIQAFHYVQTRIDNLHQALFFIDKDLDDFIGVSSPKSPSVFVTKCYSIENLWVTQEVFRFVWGEIFRLPDRDERFDRACIEFDRAHGKFMKIMLTMMAWVIWKQRNEERVMLDDANLDKFVSIDKNLRIRKVWGGYSHIRRACTSGGTTGQEWREVRRVRAELGCVEPKQVVRGKYELWFFVKFLNRLEETLRSEPGSGPKPKNRSSLSVNNAIDLIGARYVFELDVSDFIQSNLAKI